MIKMMMKIYSICISLVIIAASLYLLVWYLNQTIIPQRLKSFLIQNFEKQTNYSLDIKKLRFSLVKGFELTDAQIFNKQKPDRPFISANKIYFKAFLIPSFHGIKVIVPFIDITSPQIALERYKDGAWNTSGVKSASGKTLNFYTTRISFTGGKIAFTDQYNNRNFSKTFEGLEGKLGLFILPTVSFSISGKTDNKNLPATQFSISGNYNLGNKKLSINTDIKNAFLADYLGAYLPLDNFKFLSGALDIKGNSTVIGLKQIKANGKLTLQNTEINIKDTYLKGNGYIIGDISLELGHMDSLAYGLNYNVNNVIIRLNHPYLDKIRVVKSLGTLNAKFWDIKTFEGSIYDGPITLSGTIADPLKNLKVKIKIASEFNLANIKNCYDLGLSGGLAKIDASLSTMPEGGYQIKGFSKLKALKFKKDNLSFYGDFDTRGEFETDKTAKFLVSYKGNIVFEKAKIGLSQTFPLIEGANGEVLFQTKSATIKNLSGYAADSKITASGKLDYSVIPADININISAKQLDLNKLIQSLPDTAKTKLSDIKLEGIADVNIGIKNNIKQPEAFLYKGDLKISGASANIPWIKDSINDINANLIFERNQLAWDKASFVYKNKLYVSSGIVSEFEKPLINGSLKSEDLDAKGAIKIEDELLTVQRLDGAYKNFSVSGLNGYVKNFKEQNLEASFQSDNIKIGKFNLGNLLLELKKEDKLVSIPAIVLHPYDGIINIDAKLNLDAEKKPYLINIDAKNIDLEKAIVDMNISKSKIAKTKGSLSSAATLNGYLDEEGSLKGNGWIQVQDGYLGDFPVIFDLLDVILGIPAEHLIITDAFGNFSISGKRAYTTDLKMLSQKAAILWEGSIGFDGTLDFNITGRFAEDVIKMTTDFGKIASAVLNEAGAYIVEVKLMGTIDKPKYLLIPFAIEKIIKEKVVDKVKDAIGKIFK